MTSPEHGLAIAEETKFELPTTAETDQALVRLREFQSLVRSELIDGVDYGIIPGTDKPTLLKPGAEKIAKLLRCADEYEILQQVEDWDKPLFSYTIRATLRFLGGPVVSQGLGECNSMEAKYRWRQAQRVCPLCSRETIIKGKAEYGGGWLCFEKKGGCGAKFGDGEQAIESQNTGRVPNDDIYTQRNTLLKMAKKRALVDAALSAGRLSNLFTQDMEEIPPTASVEPAATQTTAPSKSDMLCPEHNTDWFKRGKMQNYAHPIKASGETVGWCNRPSEAPERAAEPQQKSEGPDVAPAPVAAATHDVDPATFTNAGDLMLAVSQRWPDQRYQNVTTALGVTGFEKISDFVGAWHKLVEAWG